MPFWKRKQLTFKQEIALEREKEKKAEKKQRRLEIKAKIKEEKRLKKEAKRKLKKVVAPKVGRNGLTWAEKELQKKRMDLKHLEKFQHLHLNKVRRGELKHETWSGKVLMNTKLLIVPWRNRFLVLQGHFLYIFKKDKPKAKCIRAVLVKKAEVETVGMKDRHYYLVYLRPVTPRKPFVNVTRPSRSLTDGSVVVSCPNLNVQEGLARELKRCSKNKYGGRSDDKFKRTDLSDLISASSGGMKAEKHVIKWRRMYKDPPTIAKLGLADKSGWLDREGSLTNPWVRRYFVLKGHWLYEFSDTMPSCVADRVVFLGNAKITENRLANNGFTIHSQFQRNPDDVGDVESKKYGIQCGTLDLRREWEDAVTTHSGMFQAGRSKRRPKEKRVDETLSNPMSLFQYAI
eukprot:c13332_g1_i2.p1 GENE.c13332_g1_i2~~c13332_g1_i2.p1  ORF type:complete len:402 (+),score=72.83 c13332_g1_i2:57-1262(+)